MASDVESLYAAVKSLVCVIESNLNTANEMQRVRGYQVCDMRKRRLDYKKSIHYLRYITVFHNHNATKQYQSGTVIL